MRPRLSTLLFVATLTAFTVKSAALPANPNIVVILADDFGVGDIRSLHPNTSKILTPCLDQLKTQGMTFTDAHSGSAICTPTRYGLLTGRYAWRTYLRSSVLAAYDDPLIAVYRLTLPAMLKQQGYATDCVGKWHLGWDWPFRSEAMRAKYGVAKNTLVIFTADNGHSSYTGLPALLKAGHHPSGPYRGYKYDIWEGGHHEPFIAVWPGKIKADSTCNDIICLTDLMATFASLTGADLPANAAEESVNILPDLFGTAKAPLREATVHQSGSGILSIRQGPWKLIVPGQLYNVHDDVAEKQNVAASHPKKVTQLTALLQKYIDDGRSTPGQKQNNDLPVKIK